MKIYTKAGDNGMTSLCDGSRLSKDDMRIEAYGTLDELNANIGLLLSMLQADSSKNITPPVAKATNILIEIQENLFVIGGELARAEIKSEDLISTQSLTRKIEANIDYLSAQLPLQHHFILPGGILSAAQSHVCRTICRRAERRIVTLSHVTTLSPETLIFVNRLSDYFFILSRYLNYDSGTGEKTWKNTCR